MQGSLDIMLLIWGNGWVNVKVKGFKILLILDTMLTTGLTKMINIALKDKNCTRVKMCRKIPTGYSVNTVPVPERVTY